MDYHSLNDTHKKKAAIRSAAKNATNPDGAVIDYMALTGMINLVNNDNMEGNWRIIFGKAKEEMLVLLKDEVYRHPVNSVFAERRIFFADFDGGFSFVSEGCTEPEWLVDLKKSQLIPESLLSQIKQYVIEAELAAIDRGIESELSKKTILLDNAHDDYQPEYDGEKANIRANRVAKGLGLSTGKRQKTYKPEDVYKKYVNLVRHKGLSRRNATFEVAKLFFLAENTVLDSLHGTCKEIKTIWKQYSLKEYDSTVKKCLTGFIMPKGEWDL